MKGVGRRASPRRLKNIVQAYVDLGKKEEEGDDSWANCKFHAMLATGSACHVRSKGQNGPAVNHLKMFLDLEVESKGQMKGYVPAAMFS